MTAMILGLMTAISPSPLATNVAAIGYVGKHIHNRYAAFFHGLLYILGRMISYGGLGMLINLGANKIELASLFQQFGKNFMGVIFILIGVFLLNLIKIRFSFLEGFSDRFRRFAMSLGYFSSFMLGVVFALAFCPFSGVLYFGMLIPMTIASPQGFLLLMAYAAATGFPVLIVAFLIAFPVASLGKFFDRIKVFEFYFRRIVAIVFILVGIFYLFYFTL